MTRKKHNRKPRGRTIRNLCVELRPPAASPKVELDPECGQLLERIDGEYRTGVEDSLSGPEILAIARAANKKTAKGRPSASDKWTLLDAIARRKAQERGYMDLRFKFKRTPRQLINLVQKNKNYLAGKVREILSK
jgi:hypothetical protein